MHPGLTLEAATSCAVLAAISCEHTINSSNFPLPCTTRSAASLEGGRDHFAYSTEGATWFMNDLPGLRRDSSGCLFLSHLLVKRSPLSLFRTFTPLLYCICTVRLPREADPPQGGLILTPWPWRPIPLLWRQRSGPRSSGSSWRKTPWWRPPPGGRNRK